MQRCYCNLLNEGCLRIKITGFIIFHIFSCFPTVRRLVLCFGLKATIGWTVWLHQTAAVARFKHTSSRGRWHQTRWIRLYCLLPWSSYIHCFLNCVYSGLCYCGSAYRMDWKKVRGRIKLPWLIYVLRETNSHLYPNEIKSFGAFHMFMVFQGKMTMKRKSKSRNVKWRSKEWNFPLNPLKNNEHKNEWK